MNDKRMRIILAARDVFEEKGYHEAKIAEIAKKAEVGKGTVYEYFESKQILFEEMIMVLIDIGFEELDKHLSETNNAIEQLKIIALLEAKIMFEHGQLFSLILVRLASSSDELKQKFHQTKEKQLEKLESILKYGMEQGVFKTFDPKHFALIFKGSMMQVNMNRTCMIEGLVQVDDTTKDEIFDILINSIKS